MYRPKVSFNVPMELLIPTYTTVSGVSKKTLPESGVVFYGSFKTYGGTERDNNGVYAIVDTANVETWYNPDIKSDCAVKLENGRIYDIINEPENIEMRNQFLRFKVRRAKGNA